MKKLVLVLMLLFALSVFGLDAGELDAKVLCIAGDCRTVWPTGGTGGFDGNFYSIPDFNELYWTQVDSNLTFYKQVDLNSLLQVSDFNNVYVSWTDANLTYWTQTDLNLLLQLFDFNGMIQNFGENLNWNLDTNAQTACGNNEVLLGDGNCLLYELGETYLPDTILTVAGTDSNNNDVNAIRFYDSNSYTVDEDGGSPALQVDVNFSDVNSFDSISFRQQYLGGAGHEIIVEIYDYDGLVWEEYAEITDQGSFVVSNIPVYDDSTHILDGNVSVRFRHEQSGIPTHVLLIDFVWLIKGTTTGVISEHDALSGRDSNANHPWALDKSDLNNFAGILHEAIADFNFVVLFSQDWNKFLYTQLDANVVFNKVEDSNNTGRLVWEVINLANAVLSDIAFDLDFNSTYGQIGTTTLSEWVWDADFNASYPSGSGVADGNFYSLDGNKVYHTQTDANLLFPLITDVNGEDAKIKIDLNLYFWKQIDLNSLLQFPDFNAMITHLGESEGWDASASGDGNFYSLDGNKVYYTQTDLNITLQITDFNNVYATWIDSNATYWKQIDLNNLLQIPDFNNVYTNWIDGNQTYYTQTDLNELFGANINEMLYDAGDPHFDNVTVDGLTNTGNTSFTGNVISGTARFLMDLVPNDDDQENLGATTLRWKNLWVSQNIKVDNDLNVGQDLNVGNNIYVGNCFLFADGTTQCTADLNYNSPDFNKAFYSQIDANLTFWKQIDLNSLLQFPDFNGMIVNLGESEGWDASASGDGNFYSLDGNKVYYTQTDLNITLQITDFNNVYASWIDANQTFWKQIDLNSLLQITDFNDMIINLGESQGWNLGGDGNFMSIPDSNKWFWTQIDLNAFFQIWDFNNVYAKIIDMNTDRALKAYTSDVNATDALKADILDVNGADLKIKTDLNFYFWKQIDLNWFFTNKLNLFDLNVGHDQNIGNDLNVAHNIQAGNDINATRTISIKTPVTTIEQIPDINIIWKYTNGSVTYCTRVMADGNLHMGQGAGCN